MGYPGLDLDGRIAVVVGGTSGIGLTLARGLAQAGADVVATGRRAELVESVAGEIRKLGRKTAALTCDVTDRKSVEAFHDAVCAQFDHVDILVNCAGMTKRTPTLDVSESEWGNILETNLNGTLRSCQVFGRRMIQRGYGRIINIASLSTFVSLYEVAAYSASKSAVASLTKSLAIEWAKSGVCVNAIAPGPVLFPDDYSDEEKQATVEKTLLKRAGSPQDIVNAVVFLIENDYITGEMIHVDGGRHIM